MKTAAALNESLRKRLLDACFDAFRANESLAASSKLFPATAVGLRDLDPQTAVRLYTGAVEKCLETLVALLDDDGDLVIAAESAKGGTND